jgi:hypothetical protein
VSAGGLRRDLGLRGKLLSDLSPSINPQLTGARVRRNPKAVKATVSSKGQVVLPAALRERDRVVTGQKFDSERIDAGHYLLKRQPVPDNHGLLDWLLACPEKDWFQPIASESTDAL